MLDPVPPDLAGNLGKSAAEVVRVVGESPHGRAIAGNLTDPLVFMSRAVRNVFLPLHYRNEERERFYRKRFDPLLTERVEKIPEESRVTPSESVAAPVLEGLGRSFDEEPLRDMYLNLLAAAADGRTPGSVHPAYAEIVRQLSVEEVPVLNALLAVRMSHQPIVLLSVGAIGETSKRPILRHVLPAPFRLQVGRPWAYPGIEGWVDNWIRLGLASVDYDRWLTRENVYAWVEASDEYRFVASTFVDENEEIRVDNGVFAITAFGLGFAAAVLPRA